MTDLLPLFDLPFRAIVTDFKRRKKYLSKELKVLVIKTLLKATDLRRPPFFKLAGSPTSVPMSDLPKSNYHLDFDFRDQFTNKLQAFKAYSLTRVRNRCVYSGRNSSLTRFRLSRIAFREHAGSGILKGVTKRLNK